MQIAVTFRHVESDEGIRNYVNEKVKRLEKYFENPREAHVVLSGEKFRHTAEITIAGDRATLIGQGRDTDLYKAVDQMVEKVERQIRERRGKGRRKKSGLIPSIEEIPEDKELSEKKEEGALFRNIQRRRTLAKPMSIEEAVAQMDLSSKNLLVFVNSDSGLMNVLYRRNDGGYEWVEPRSK